MKGVEFDGADIASRWWPHGKKLNILLDPDRSFGHPIVAASGVQTSVLADAYKVEGSFEAVANWYDVSVQSVKNAVLYEDNPVP